jgi:hypothetical protein
MIITEVEGMNQVIGLTVENINAEIEADPEIKIEDTDEEILDREVETEPERLVRTNRGDSPRKGRLHPFKDPRPPNLTTEEESPVLRVITQSILEKEILRKERKRGIKW